jgi:hypothetical protein
LARFLCDAVAVDRPAAELPAAKPRKSFLFWGWWLAGLSVLLPFLALGGLIFGVFALTRDKPGHGAGMIVASLVGPVIWVYVMSSVTLQPSS